MKDVCRTAEVLTCLHQWLMMLSQRVSILHSSKLMLDEPIYWGKENATQKSYCYGLKRGLIKYLIHCVLGCSCTHERTIFLMALTDKAQPPACICRQETVHIMCDDAVRRFLFREYSLFFISELAQRPLFT